MTLQEALDITDEMKPNMMKRETKIRMLMDLENMIYDEILMKHEHAEEQEQKPEYTEETEPDTELLVPDPYGTEMYPYWLMSKIDSMNMEYDKYNNDRAMFENAYDSMSDWWTRTKMPLQAMPFVRI